MPESPSVSYQVEVFFDGGCPLCVREIAMLKRRDRHNQIRFTDIDSASFDSQQVGKSYSELMAKMHGRLPDGSWIEGVEVFRRLYAAVGFTRFVALSRLPPICWVLDLGYAVFARNRLRLTGRCIAQSCPANPPAAPPR